MVPSIYETVKSLHVPLARPDLPIYLSILYVIYPFTPSLKVLVSIKQDLYDLGAPDTSGFPAIDTDDARLIVAAFGKDGPPVAAKRLTVKGRQFPVTVELTADDLAFPLTKV